MKKKHLMRRKKTQIGPERRQVEEYEVSAREATLENVSSGCESKKNMRTLNDKSEKMVSNIENLMIANHLAVTTGKTQRMCFRDGPTRDPHDDERGEKYS